VSAVVAVVVGVAAFSWARVLVARRSVAQIEQRVLVNIAIASPAVAVLPYEPSTSRLGRFFDNAERRLARRAWWRALEHRVERAGIERRPAELAAALAVISVVAALMAAGASGGPAALVALAAPAALAWWGLGLLARRRLKAFDEQLPDLLSGLAGSLRAGHGFLQSLQVVAQDAPKPAGDELRRALRETRLGRPVDEALAGIGRRVPSRDFDYVLTAISVQRTSGGSLAGLFETVNETVRQRQQFARKVRALTATGRTSANALITLPFGMGLLLTLINHSYLVPLFSSHAGRIMLIGAGLMMSVGIVVVRRVVSFQV
jgi:tight adherence protein B